MSHLLSNHIETRVRVSSLSCNALSCPLRMDFPLWALCLHPSASGAVNDIEPSFMAATAALPEAILDRVWRAAFCVMRVKNIASCHTLSGHNRLVDREERWLGFECSIDVLKAVAKGPAMIASAELAQTCWSCYCYISVLSVLNHYRSSYHAPNSSSHSSCSTRLMTRLRSLLYASASPCACHWRLH